MHAAFATIRTAGVTVLAAGSLVIAPVSPQVSTTSIAVQLSATSVPKPAEFYRAVADATADNVGQLWQKVVSDPFPIARVVVDNQVAFGAELAETVAGILRGDLPITQALVPLVNLVATAAKNFVTVTIGAVASLPALAVTIAVPVLSTLVSAAFALADVVRAIGHLNVVEVVDSVLNLPAWIVNGFLNGTNIPNEALPLAIPGLLATGNAPVTGPVNSVIETTQRIAGDMSHFPTTVEPVQESEAPAPQSVGAQTRAADETDAAPISIDDVEDRPEEPSPNATTVSTGAEAENPELRGPGTASPSESDPDGSGAPRTERKTDGPLSTRREAGSTRTAAAAASPAVSPPRSPGVQKGSDPADRTPA